MERENAREMIDRQTTLLERMLAGTYIGSALRQKKRYIHKCY
jgi:hypothetical protein